MMWLSSALLLVLLPCYWLAPGLLLGFILWRESSLDERILRALALGFALPALAVPWSRLMRWPYKEVWGAFSIVSIIVLAWLLVRRRRDTNRPRTAYEPPLLTAMAVGIAVLSYLLPVIRFLAPPGQDMAMHLTMARLIFTHGAIPTTFDPVYPGLPFGAYPLGFHAMVGLAAVWLGDVIRGGLLVTALVHAFVPVALYLAVKRDGRDWPTALAALLTAWVSRNPQAHLGWGGNPSVFGTALAFIALRWALDVPAVPTRRQMAGGALLLAAVPLVHPTSALIAVYLAPLILAVLLLTRRVAARRRTWSTLAIVAGAAALLVVPQILALLDVTTTARESGMLHEVYLGLDPMRAGFFKYFGAQFGDGLMILVVVATVANLIRYRQPRWELGLLGGLALLEGFVWITSRWELPGWFALYPERIMLFALPVFALILRRFVEPLLVEMGHRFQAGKRSWRPFAASAMLTGLLALAVVKHWDYFVAGAAGKELIRPVDLEAFDWMATNLPPGSMVANNYDDAGVYLSAFTGLPITHPQTNPVWFEEMHTAVLNGLPIVAGYVGAHSAAGTRNLPIARPVATELILFRASAGIDTALVVDPRRFDITAAIPQWPDESTGHESRADPEGKP